MNARNDPLDDLIPRFIAEAVEFLAMKADVDPPPKIDTGNPVLDFMQNWEEVKRHIHRCGQALAGRQPEVAQRLDNIISLGNAIKKLTDDPNILNPVDGVVMRMIDERAEYGKIIPQMANATSISTVISLIGELLGFGNRTIARRKEIAEMLEAMRMYNGRSPRRSA
ncbi:hypothetical protein [Mycolicibacterium aichiense]|uniref:Uncharacterized protein n=1 Tax=Mycolicibacterium aichiense TaxID=1799 RepID=A0AAD1HK54_9MYCO|nr:hypothetical protein [Mycolicibacterium aichiense]MCV7017979.1 hypothetical protein [Mycolicibacterium aichiense]BBX06404.1 hypothetical protein MAIC_12070 [Mycolicibacterium aichiense]STZ24260.1 Uncharacterised protein [Mycolicibacterium aichiense]